MRARVGHGLDRLRVAAVEFDEWRRIGFGRIGEQALGHVQQFLDAHARACRCEAHRYQMALAQALLEGVVQFLAGQSAFAQVQVMFHHGLVDLHHLVDDLLVPVGHIAQVGDAGGLPEAVDDRLAAVGGQVERQHFGAELLAQRRQHAGAVGAFVVDLVDDDGAAQVALGGAFHEAARAMRDALVGVDHDQGGFHRGKGRQGRAAEFRIPRRVDQVDVHAAVVGAGDGGIDGVAAALLEGIMIGHGGAAFDGACHLEGAAGMQQGFEERCFAGAGVACQGHVADLLRAVRHEAVPPVGWVEGPSWLSGQSASRERGARRAVMAGGQHRRAGAEGSSRTAVHGVNIRRCTLRFP